MSKKSRQQEPSLDSGRPLTPMLGTRRNNILLNPNPSSSKLMIGNKESPYSQIQSIAKANSSSNLKHRPQLHLKKASPSRLSNQSVILKANDSRHSLLDKRDLSISKHSSSGNSLNDYKEILTEKLANYQKEASFIEIHLNEKLQSKNLDFKQNSEKDFEIYREIFDEVIKKDIVFAAVLQRIKDAYDSVIVRKASSKTLKELNQKIKEISYELNCQQDINRSKEKELEKQKRENAEISKRLNRSEEICTEIQKKLCYITNFNISEVPKEDNKWKALLLENKTYFEAIGKLKDDIKNYKHKEKKLLKLILALKQRGYPVEEVFETDVESKKEKSLPNYSESGIMESCSETENIVSGRPVNKDKPSCVPGLNLGILEPEFFDSSSSSYDSYYTTSYD
ncbi:hypothetical protein SteCoe_30941 [Stentor coeruleus]|uniref:Translin-associated factor X-interacting protein 1 N-terminal domain-containing protein n=1 Tax=Stentor coeruleus TaxID=5963 RepID=A0A1R2B2J7_9CILI|nr:hypothetical protein SteCoe_30941 [Stentor coeruleus]